MSKAEIQRALFGKVGRRRKLGPESVVLHECLSFLQSLPYCHAWRQNTGATPFVRENGQRAFVRFGQKGMSDICGILHGYYLSVETKAPGEEPSDEQDAWLTTVRYYGGIAFWCDSYDMCVVKLRVAYTLRGWEWPL